MQLERRNSTEDCHSYLLRVWRVNAETGVVWRASLETIGIRERHGFAQLKDLVAFLQNRFQSPSERPRENQ